MNKIIEKKETPKIALIYSIYSPSLDLWYYGSTFNRLSLRKAIHLYNWKQVKQEKKEENLTAYQVLKGEDCIFNIEQKLGAGYSKQYLLTKEKEYIRKMKQIHKDKVVNKNDGITDNMKQYQKKYRETNEDYFKNYRNTHKAYFKAYREKRKNSINEARREQYKTNQRDAIVKKLNDGSYKKIPYKKIEKYNIGYNDKIKLYY